MPVTLDEIVQQRRAEVARLKAETDVAELRRRSEAHQPRGFRRALAEASRTRPAIIAELKKASPSRGVIRGSFHPARLAASLASAGAAALSVLTEEAHFQGSLANLNEASAACDLPCLRKDFIVDEFQLIEARANHADCVLLIAAALTWAELRALHGAALLLGLDVLVEVHDEAELGRVAALGCDLIGVNSRDLRTFHVDLNTAHTLAPKTPNNALLVAESGIKSGEDMRQLRAAGYQAFLVGESLMQADDPGAALQRLLGEAKAPPLGTAGVSMWGTGAKD